MLCFELQFRKINLTVEGGDYGVFPLFYSFRRVVVMIEWVNIVTLLEHCLAKGKDYVGIIVP